MRGIYNSANYAPIGQLEVSAVLKSVQCWVRIPLGVQRGVSTTVSALACQTRDVSSILIHRSSLILCYGQRLYETVFDEPRRNREIHRKIVENG